MRITVGSVAIVVVGFFLGLALLPDYLFFPLVGVSALIVGLFLLKTYPLWGIGVMLLGAVAVAYGIKFANERRRLDREEGEKAAEEVRRRMGRVRDE